MSVCVSAAQAKDAKEADFAEGWKTMKQGKNKPLDEEEVEFLDEMELQKREDEKKRLEREKDDMECFKLMRETMVVKAEPPRTVGRGGAGARAGAAAGGSTGSKKRGAGNDDAAGEAGAGAKKPKPSMLSTPKFVPKFKAVPKKAPPGDVEGKKKDDDDDEGGGLGGLLGYGSGSEDD